MTHFYQTGSQRGGAREVGAQTVGAACVPAHMLTACAATLLAAATLVLTPAEVRATPVTACTRLDICYCVNTDYSDAIKDNVARVRQLISDKKASGKTIGYLSVPLSPAGGGSFAINTEAADSIVTNTTARLGPRSVWLLNPGAEGGDKMKGASGADYMYMWTQILEGKDGSGRGLQLLLFCRSERFRRLLQIDRSGRSRRAGGLVRQARGQMIPLSRSRSTMAASPRPASGIITRCAPRSRSATARTTSGISRA